MSDENWASNAELDRAWKLIAIVDKRIDEEGAEMMSTEALLRLALVHLHLAEIYRA